MRHHGYQRHLCGIWIFGRALIDQSNGIEILEYALCIYPSS